MFIQTETTPNPATLKFIPGRLVLDAGCGGGRYARLAGSHGAKLIGVDLSSAVVNAARLCAGLAGVAILQADLLDLPLADQAFDVVYSIGVLHHTPNPRRAFAEIARKVKPGGRLAAHGKRAELADVQLAVVDPDQVARCPRLDQAGAGRS